ncbi:MAG TPA: polysaccharide biosynthesis/export family protein, partial [Nitrospira sp.]|nr:polysaccharide biosynthesis/export family protein [Nitrospira sp.]
MNPFGSGGLGMYGLPSVPGQTIVTNPNALQPLTPTQTPCPPRPPSDLSPESTIPNLNDYWPLEPRTLLPGSVEQRLRQEQEELDRKQESIRVEKERRELEYRAQLDREKQTLARRPGVTGMLGSVTPPVIPGQQPLTPEQRSPAQMEREKKPFTGELLRQQNFTVEEAFAQFSILQGVQSRLKQYGYDFFDANASTFSAVQDVPVGPDYVVGPQDSLGIHIWNVPDQNFNRSYIAPVERDGMLVLPQVGAIPVGGQTFAQAEKTIRARLSGLLKRFELHVSMARIRTMKVYVVGEVVRPGAYELSALATASNALYAACGPARSGSLRQVKVMREGNTVAELDLYDFLMQGDRRGDHRLQSGDVVMVPPLGPVVAISGAVKRPAIYETKTGTRLTELL